MKILWLESPSDPMVATLATMGQVDFGTDLGTLGQYDLVAANCLNYSGDFLELLKSAMDAGISLGLIHLQQDQIKLLARETGISPSQPADGAIVGKAQLGGHKVWQVKYLPTYDHSVLEAARRGGLDVQNLVETYIKTNVAAHVAAMNTAVVNPAINNLIPNFSLAPFGLVRMAPKPISVAVNGFQNLSSLAMTTSAQIYCYQEDSDSNNDFVVIIITQMNDIPNGNSVSYGNFNHSCCEAQPETHGEDQYFNYGAAIQAKDQNGKPITAGIRVYSSSPHFADHGPTVFNNQVQISLNMDVNNAGTFGPTTFNAQYTRTLESPANKWYDIVAKDDQSNALAGVLFNMPNDKFGYFNGDSSPQPVQFETASIFRFPANLVSDGKFPIQFSFVFTLGVFARDRVTIHEPKDPSSTTVTTSHSDQTVTVNSDLLDLVALTKLQAP